MNRKELIIRAFACKKLHPALNLIWAAFWSSTSTTNEMEAVLRATAAELGTEYPRERDFCAALLTAVQQKRQEKGKLKPRWFIRTVLITTKWVKARKVNLEVEDYFTPTEYYYQQRVVIQHRSGNAFSDLSRSFPFNLF